MLNRKSIYVANYASGVGAPDSGTAEGPGVLKKSRYIDKLADKGLDLHWGELVNIKEPVARTMLDNITMQCNKLAQSIYTLVKEDKFFLVFGGDHSCAIGTWSGARAALTDQHDLGLIWIDAHMDSHTPDTSPTGNIHGMPVASLLGHGNIQLVNLLKAYPKLKPENICLIGVRSYEEGEAELLKKLNVRVFLMEEVKQRGLVVVMKEALNIVKKNTYRFGVSIDIDAIDPNDAPGTGVAESNGILASDLYQGLQLLKNEKQLIGVEIAEFDPHRDKEHITEQVIANLILSFS